ncbi:MAG: manganese efflux pump MntP family protein [Ruminococcus sp.]|nr:manganese efflux pump MntP family protein [Alistipes senegalensis]MDE6424933.1 manganese efflux pump MntP family protein [Ruminococcus sp.]
MNLTELFLLAVGLAADAFSAAVCQGIRMKKINLAGALLTALFFGVFQAGMPLIGCFLGNRFAEVTARYDHWIAFILLGITGGKMIWEAFSPEESSDGEYTFSLKDIFMLSLATSIDAMAIGVVFSAQKTDIFLSVSVIGIVTFLLSLAGVFIGNRFGSKYGKGAEITGGAVLIFIGLKLFLN